MIRPITGFLALHLLFGAVGLLGLWSLGIVETRGRRWTAGLAAAGPAVLLGMIVVTTTAILALVAGVAVTGATIAVIAALWSGALGGGGLFRARRRGLPAPESGSVSRRWLGPTLAGFGATYVLAGMVALAEVPTRGDDARIWSLRGLSLFYYPHLKSEIFLNPFQAGAHPVYPLLQPLLQSTLGRFMGSPQLRFFHAELWLMFALVLWTVGYLIVQRFPVSGRRVPLWLAGLVLLGLSPHVVRNLVVGDADTLGSALLGAGIVTLALWAQHSSAPLAVLAAVLLCGAAGTKDEDLTVAAVVLAIAGVWTLGQVATRTSRSAATLRLRQLAQAAPIFVIPVLGWRLWLSAHHLADSVQPPLPEALSPTYVLGRTTQLRETADAMLAQVHLHWDGVTALFIAVCLLCLTQPRGRRAALMYLSAFLATVLVLLWLYATTPLSLGFLLPTSMDRTVSVLMAPAALAVGHLLMELIAPAGPAPPLAPLE